MDITDNQTITLIASDGQEQTKWSTIKCIDKLCALIDPITFQIHIDTGIIDLQRFLEYLRGYRVEIQNMVEYIKRFDLRENGYVYINIGGRQFYVEQVLMESNFSYFTSFFKYNMTNHPDYSNIIIDRSSRIFNKIINLMEQDKLSNSKELSMGIHDDLIYYGYQNSTLRYRIDDFHFYSSCGLLRMIEHCEIINNTVIVNPKYSLIHISNHGIKPNQIEFYDGNNKCDNDELLINVSLQVRSDKLIFHPHLAKNITKIVILHPAPDLKIASITKLHGYSRSAKSIILTHNSSIINKCVTFPLTTLFYSQDTESNNNIVKNIHVMIPNHFVNNYQIIKNNNIIWSDKAVKNPSGFYILGLPIINLSRYLLSFTPHDTITINFFNMENGQDSQSDVSVKCWISYNYISL
jgi:hypothetical protein